MKEKNEPVFENEEFLLLLRKYEQMKTDNSSTFFDVEEFEQIIDYYLDEFQYENAAEAAEFGSVQHPTSVEIKYKNVHIFLEQGIGKRAIEMLENIPDFELSNPEFHYLKGTALCLTGRNQDAEKSFDEGLGLATDDTFEALLNIAIAFENARHYRLAIKYLKQAHEISPGYPSILYDLGYFHERIDQYETSIQYYQKYLDLDPFSENVWYNLGVVFFKLKKPAEAIEAYDYSIALNPDYASAYFNKANTYASINNYDKAISSMREFLELEPDNTQALSFLGECYEHTYKYKDSLEAYKKIIEADNTDTEGWFGAGMILYQMNKFSEASIYLLKALEFDAKNIDFWINLGYIYEAEGKAQEAIKCYRQVTLIDVNDYEAWISLNSLLMRMKEFELALVYLREAFIQFPGDDRLRIRLAECHFRRGTESVGIKYLKAALISNSSVVEEFEKSYKKILWSPAIHEMVGKYVS